MDSIQEYLVSYGTAGDFGRFRPARPLECRRGDSVVVQTHRGLELGTVLCEARTGHAQFLPNTSLGQLLRRATSADQQTALQLQEHCRRFFDSSRRRAAELSLPLEILDAELLLDGRQAVLHYLRWTECDERPLVSSLCSEYGYFVALHNLHLPDQPVKEEPAGCGAENCGGGHCGSEHGGHCSTCSVAELFKHRQAPSSPRRHQPATLPT